MIPFRVRSPIPQLRACLNAPRFRRCALLGTVCGLGCLHLFIAVASVQQKSATYDEIAHITAGYSYWKQNDYRLHPENGNLPQRWITLPLVICSSDLTFPDLNTDAWRWSDLWRIGDEFFHKSGNDVGRMLLTARATTAIVSLALCILVFFWSHSLFGSIGGLISLVVCAFSPTVLAHGRLATSDLITAFFFSAAVWSVWTLLHRLTLPRLVAGAIAVSSLFLWITLTPRQTITMRLPGGRRYALSSQGARRAYVLAVTLCIGIAAYSCVWAAYGFRYSASPENDHTFYKFRNIETVARHSGRAGAAAAWLADHRVLPEAYLYGVAFVAAHEERAAFFNGEYETTGWRSFFPYCLAVKTPLAFFGLLAFGMIALPNTVPTRIPTGAANSSKWATAYQLTPIVISLVILWSVFLVTQLNIGHRQQGAGVGKELVLRPARLPCC
ncbi:MAG: hypothetical protein HYV60_22880 [Planctomycetia bacterium]|nr:hypothetical protein [Planctomycetia bacterium]